MHRQPTYPRATEALRGLIAGVPISLALWSAIALLSIKLVA